MARVTRSDDLALDAAVPESAWNHDSGHAHQRRRVACVELLGRDPADVDREPVVDARVLQRLDHAEVRVGQRHVLADQGYGHACARVLDAVDELDPRPVVGRMGGLVQLEVPRHHLAEAGSLEHQRHLVYRVDVRHGDHRLARHVAEQRDLLLEVRVDLLLGAADDRVRLDADGAERMHRVLRGLGLHLLAMDDRHERAVHVEHVLAPEVVLQLADRFQERKAFDVADGPTHLDHDGIHLRVARGAEDLLLDDVGHVRDDLHRCAQVVASPLARDDLLVDLSGRHVGRDRQVLVDEPLVVPEVKVGLSAVIGDEHLTVLVGAHRAGVDVEVGVELLEGDAQPPGLQDVPDRGRGDAFA